MGIFEIGLSLSGAIFVVAIFIAKRWVESKFRSLEQGFRGQLEEKLAILKSELRTEESKSQGNWEIRRDACLHALDILNALYANVVNSGFDSKGRPITESSIMKQPRPKIEDIRRCDNLLAVACESPEVIERFRNCVRGYDRGIDPPPQLTHSLEQLAYFREAVRAELGLPTLEHIADLDEVFLAKVPGATESPDQ